MMFSPRLKENWKIIVLITLIVAGVALEYFEVFDWRSILAWAKDSSQHTWLPFFLILLQVVLFMFALPGSSILWIVAPIYEPVMATAILVTGSTLGGLAAYWFANQTQSPLLHHVRQQQLFKQLQKRSDFISLFSLRVFPGFPHSLINYSAGILKLPLSTFVISAILGLGIKTYLYAGVIYEAASTSSLPELGRIEIIGPLLLVVLLSLLTKFVWFNK